MKRILFAALFLAPTLAFAQQGQQPDAKIATYQQLLSEANGRIAELSSQAQALAEKAKQADGQAKHIADLEDQIKKLSGQE
jgi:hypothetical protein